MGLKVSNSTLVAMNVVPHTKMVSPAVTCPAVDVLPNFEFMKRL